MDGNASDEECENIDWDTEDELEIENIPISSSSSHVATRSAEAIVVNGEASSLNGPSKSKMVKHFLGMGFSEKLIEKAIKETGEDKPESAILEAILTYSLLDPVQKKKYPSSAIAVMTQAIKNSRGGLYRFLRWQELGV